MKLNAVLGAIVGMLFLGTICTFAFCMVEDIDESTVSPEYIYIEKQEDDILAEAAGEELPQKPAETEIAAPKKEKEKPQDIAEASAEDEFDEEAVPAAVTAVPRNDEEPVTVPAKTESEQEEDHPTDYDVDEYDDSNTEANAQSVYGGDNNEDSTLSVEDEEVEDDETYEIFGDPSWVEEDSSDSEPQVSQTAEVTLQDQQQKKSDIVITFFDNGNSQAQQEDTADTETSDDQQNVQSGSITTGETFTAKFDGAVQTVNAYDLICWIVNNEVSASFSDEAIKAQAVAAYSYVKYHNVNGLTPNVLVKKNPPQHIKDMVSSVWGVCCYYNGKVAQTVYMASSSGYTADAANVWGGSFPYLKSVACPFDVGNDPNYGSTKTVSESEMRSYLENSLGITLSNDPYNWIKITGYVDGNYVSSINIDDQTTISGRKMRESVFNYKLKSAAFDVYYSDGTFTFITYGYGHGVGMSQNGANILAKQGYSYSDILKYYFTGIEVL